MAENPKAIDRSEVLQSLLDFCTKEENLAEFHFESPDGPFQRLGSHEILSILRAYREAGYVLNLLDRWYHRNKRKREELDLEMIESLKAALTARWVSRQ
jgi:hypothetical protein